MVPSSFLPLRILVGDDGFEPPLFLIPNQVPYRARRITEVTPIL